MKETIRFAPHIRVVIRRPRSKDMVQDFGAIHFDDPGDGEPLNTKGLNHESANSYATR